MNYFTNQAVAEQMMSLTAVMVLAYLIFVLFSENLSPFSKPRIPSLRARWRYSRRLALATLTGGLLFVVLSELLRVSLLQSMAVGLSVAMILALYFSAGRIRQALHH